MKKLLKKIFSLSITLYLLLIYPNITFAKEFKPNNLILLDISQNNIINYEKSQPSSIDNPVVDPNFNVMRSSETGSSKATFIVVGLLIAATIIPLATWWYFSK